MLDNAEPANPGVILLRKVDLASGSTATTVATINTSSNDTTGDVIYKKNLNVEVLPGEVVFVNVPAVVSGSLSFKASIYIEPRWEVQANVSDMRETT